MSIRKADYIAKYGEEAWEKEAERRRQYERKYDATHKEARAEGRRRYRQTHKEEITLREKQYRQANKEEIAKQRKEYRETHREEISLQRKQYRKEHKEEISAYNKKHYQEHKDEKAAYDKCRRKNKKQEISKYNKQYNQTQSGRAINIAKAYSQADKKRGFDTSNNIDKDWIIDTVFTSQCAYCGDDDWTHLGADRIDNTKPHTPENCIPACFICNVERADKYTVEEFKQYRSLHPRVLGDNPEKSWEIIELESGLKVIKKK